MSFKWKKGVFVEFTCTVCLNYIQQVTVMQYFFVELFSFKSTGMSVVLW